MSSSPSTPAILIKADSTSDAAPPQPHALSAVGHILSQFVSNPSSTSLGRPGQVVQVPAGQRQASAHSVASAGSAASVADDGVQYSLVPGDYQLGKVIGFGSSAIVYVATYRPVPGKPLAIKVIDLDQFERNQIDELRKELQVMNLCKHPNLLNVRSAFVNGSKLYIVTPLLYAGSCLDIMRTAFPDGLDEASIACILKQALMGLDYLHRNGLIHRDVKSGNLLMDEDGTVKLADFGVSSSLFDSGERKGMRKTFVGTPCWIAPEVVQQTGYDSKADIWSFGITALELAHGRAPFAKYPPMKVLLMTLQNDPPTLDRAGGKRKFTKSFKEMIDVCLQKDPVRRPTAEKLLQHAFFKHAKKKQYLVETIVKKLPSVLDRPNREPQTREVAVLTEHSWDFPEGATSLPTFGPDELIENVHLNSNEVSPSPSDENLALGSLAAGMGSSSQDQVNSLSSSGAPLGSVQQKKGRFTVDVAASPQLQPMTSSEAGTPVLAPTASTKLPTSTQHSRSASSATPTMPAHSNHVPNLANLTGATVAATSSATAVGLGVSVDGAAGEVKKGRFSVIGEQPNSPTTTTSVLPTYSQPPAGHLTSGANTDEASSTAATPQLNPISIPPEDEKRGRFEVKSAGIAESPAAGVVADGVRGPISAADARGKRFVVESNTSTPLTVQQSLSLASNATMAVPTSTSQQVSMSTGSATSTMTDGTASASTTLNRQPESHRRGRFEVTSSSTSPSTNASPTDRAEHTLESLPERTHGAASPPSASNPDLASSYSDTIRSTTNWVPASPSIAPSVMGTSVARQTSLPMPMMTSGGSSMVDQLSFMLLSIEQQRSVLADLVSRLRQPYTHHAGMPISHTLGHHPSTSSQADREAISALQSQLWRVLKENEDLARENRELRVLVDQMQHGQQHPQHAASSHNNK